METSEQRKFAYMWERELSGTGKLLLDLTV
jgi:hypothetical protein